MNRLCAFVGCLLLAPAAAAQDMPLSQVVVPGQGWKLLPSAKLPPLPAIALDGGKARYATGPIAAGPNARPMFATATGKNQLFTMVPGEGGQKVFVQQTPLKEPTGVVLWRDGGTLVVADAADKYLWAFRVEKNGSLSDGERYYPLRVRKGQERSEAGGLVVDTDGRVYAATSEGVQVFDPTGRLCGVLLPPAKGKLTELYFDSDDPHRLCVACDGKVYGRQLLSRGFFPGKDKAPSPKKK